MEPAGAEIAREKRKRYSDGLRTKPPSDGQAVDGFDGAADEDFDAAVAAVAHPAVEIKSARLVHQSLFMILKKPDKVSI
jgi:hypothetical protein